jgi:hypothetical protein
MSPFSPVTAINADIANGAAISEEFEVFVCMEPDTDMETATTTAGFVSALDKCAFEEIGKVQSDSAFKIAREFINVGEDWLNIPKNETVTIEGKLLQTGNIEVVAHVLGKPVDTTSDTEYDILGLSDKPEIPGKYLYRLASSASDGRKVLIYFWRGQMVCPEFSIQGNDPSNPPAFTLNASPDTSKPKEIRRGLVLFEKKTA